MARSITNLGMTVSVEVKGALRLSNDRVSERVRNDRPLQNCDQMWTVTEKRAQTRHESRASH